MVKAQFATLLSGVSELLWKYTVGDRDCRTSLNPRLGHSVGYTPMKSLASRRLGRKHVQMGHVFSLMFKFSYYWKFHIKISLDESSLNLL